MKKRRIATSFVSSLISLIVLILLPKEELIHTIWLMMKHRDELPRLLPYLWRAEPTRLLAVGIFAVLLLIFLISVLVFISSVRRAVREGLSRPEVMARSEQAVGCQHPAGREKYLRQLDEHLKSGLIDKAEYKLLRERYLRMDIDESLH